MTARITSQIMLEHPTSFLIRHKQVLQFRIHIISVNYQLLDWLIDSQTILRKKKVHNTTKTIAWLTFSS